MIRKISIKDKENWKKLYKGYAYFSNHFYSLYSLTLKIT